MAHHQIVIVGGGNAGISVAAQLLRQDKSLDIAIVDPSEKHFYQPAWTLVGGGAFDIRDTIRTEEEVIPRGAKWIQKKVATFQPEQNSVRLHDDSTITYDYLVVAPGIQLNWHEVKGLQETLGKNGVCSNYSFETAPYTFECISNLKQGKAIFNNPHTPVKCGGAPQKIMYLASDYFKKHGLADKVQVEYWSGGTRLFGVQKYEKTLLEVVKRNNIHLQFFVKLTEVDGPNKIAKFIGTGADNKDVPYEVPFDMFHVTPPQGAPDFIKASPLANEAGWVAVDKNSLQHVRYQNIFSLGDASSLPTSRTGAAIRKQAPVLVANLLSAMKHQPLLASYNGYTSCPIITGFGKLVLAEFDYDNQPLETFPFDQSQERWSMYQLKRRVLPWMYWNRILTGKM
ncbi:MAG TPA: FAD/NAD(P)-binding oxidoreductase [Flavisolibacter sp.]